MCHKKFRSIIVLAIIPITLIEAMIIDNGTQNNNALKGWSDMNISAINPHKYQYIK